MIKSVLYKSINYPDDLVVNFVTLTYTVKPHNIEEVKDLSNWGNNVTSGKYSDFYFFNMGNVMSYIINKFGSTVNSGLC